MRFVVTGEWKRNRLLRLILLMFLVFVLLFWVSAGLMYFTRGMTLKPSSVVQYYLGDKAQPTGDGDVTVEGGGTDEFASLGRPARSLSMMTETTHVHLFTMGMLVMVLTHLLLFVPISPRAKYQWVMLSFVSTLVNELSGWLVRFVSPSFAWLKVGGFLAMELSLGGLVVLLAMYTAKPQRNAYADTAKSTERDKGQEKDKVWE